jgi:hypothetical protein
MDTNQPPSAAAPAVSLPPDAQLLQLATGAFISQAVYVAAKLGIADLLAEGPKTCESLSAETSTDENALYRTLRAIASAGVFTEVASRTFANTPMSDTLRADHPTSTRELTVWLNEPDHWNVYGQLTHSVRTGEPAWDKVHGEPVFKSLFETNTELGDIFNRAMTSFSHQTIPAIIEAYDFSAAGTVADIAGGYGHLLGAVLKANPGLKGILFELPQVLDGAPAMIESYGVSDRVEYISGDFTEDIPVKADVYFMKHIIHDWYDDKNVKILNNIRRSMPYDAKVLIIDTIIPEGDEPHFGKIMDLEMLLTPGGKERTPDEFEGLLNAAGFRMTRIIPTRSLVGIVEAVKN